ncbi:hypothetical protein HKX48_009034 [Thoreauomyces humboldtii]|nr:hypothetical protein HKX48_009034 [Thoreauomyces humboldtii]
MPDDIFNADLMRQMPMNGSKVLTETPDDILIAVLGRLDWPSVCRIAACSSALRSRVSALHRLFQPYCQLIAALCRDLAWDTTAGLTASAVHGASIPGSAGELAELASLACLEPVQIDEHVIENAEQFRWMGVFSTLDESTHDGEACTTSRGSVVVPLAFGDLLLGYYYAHEYVRRDETDNIELEITAKLPGQRSVLVYRHRKETWNHSTVYSAISVLATALDQSVETVMQWIKTASALDQGQLDPDRDTVTFKEAERLAPGPKLLYMWKGALVPTAKRTGLSPEILDGFDRLRRADRNQHTKNLWLPIRNYVEKARSAAEPQQLGALDVPTWIAANFKIAVSRTSVTALSMEFIANCRDAGLENQPPTFRFAVKRGAQHYYQEYLDDDECEISVKAHFATGPHGDSDYSKGFVTLLKYTRREDLGRPDSEAESESGEENAVAPLPTGHSDSVEESEQNDEPVSVKFDPWWRPNFDLADETTRTTLTAAWRAVDPEAELGGPVRFALTLLAFSMCFVVKKDAFPSIRRELIQRLEHPWFDDNDDKDDADYENLDTASDHSSEYWSDDESDGEGDTLTTEEEEGETAGDTTVQEEDQIAVYVAARRRLYPGIHDQLPNYDAMWLIQFLMGSAYLDDTAVVGCLLVRRQKGLPNPPHCEVWLEQKDLNMEENEDYCEELRDEFLEALRKPESADMLPGQWETLEE